tara:strand:+ start:6465 stop:7466 length:1002 start_codon:yes stop_codon:yes gene_type:complete
MYKLIFFLLLAIPIAAEHVVIDKGIYKAWYSPKLEQPIKVSYLVLNRPNIVGREDMKFYEETNIHTSNNKDYYNNEWDKGHMAPAIHFSDSVENLKATYSYVNSALQHINLNRGAWRDLETAVRSWAENETLFVENNILFEEGSFVLESGATVPSGFEKNIKFIESGNKKCYFFPNKSTDRGWHEYEKDCTNDDSLPYEDKCDENELFFIEPSNGFKTNEATFKVKFGSKNISINPAGIVVNKTELCSVSGHHHLIINKSYDVSVNKDEPIPFARNILHFGGGQTEAELSLQPGKYTLQLILGDYQHKPVSPPGTGKKYEPIVSNIIEIEILP